MRKLRPLLLTVFVILPTFTYLDAQADPKKGGQKQSIPVGIWEYQLQTIGPGKPLPQGALDQIWLEITETSFIRCGKTDNVDSRHESKLICYPDRRPMEFDLVFTHPITKKVSTSKGIYKVVGDQLTLCYDNTGNTRPTMFKPGNEEGIALSILKRKSAPMPK